VWYFMIRAEAVTVIPLRFYIYGVGVGGHAPGGSHHPTVGDDDATIAPAVVEPGGGAVARALGEAEVTALLGATAGVATIDPRADPDHPAAASYHLRVMSMSARILTWLRFPCVVENWYA
jgi:hypothetical protein